MRFSHQISSNSRVKPRFFLSFTDGLSEHMWQGLKQNFTAITSPESQEQIESDIKKTATFVAILI
jgi:hypothetical protein